MATVIGIDQGGTGANLIATGGNHHVVRQNAVGAPFSAGQLSAVDDIVGLAIATGKTLTVSNTITLNGTDGTVMIFPATSAVMARVDAAQVFLGDQTFNGHVGIGTAPTPISSLEILGNTALNGSLFIVDTVAALGSLAGHALYVAQTWNTTASTTAFRLNVTNTASGSNSSLFDFQIANASLLRLRSNGALYIGNGNPVIQPANPAGTSVLGGTSFRLTTNNDSVVGYNYHFVNGLVLGTSQISGDNGSFLIRDGFAPTSGSGSFAQIKLAGIINQTGGANGVTIGIWLANTLTAVANYRSIQIDNNTGYGIYQGGAAAKNYFAGSVGIGITTAAASTLLDITSTTKGVLLPRMTKAQRDAILTPAQGLIVFVTDGTGYLSWFNTTWQKVSSVAD